MSAVMSGLRDAQGRAIETLPVAVRQALMAADTILRLHGMQFELLCADCYRRARGPNDATVIAKHSEGDGSVSELVCNCKRRNFRAAF
jgi:hypothetical protein